MTVTDYHMHLERGPWTLEWLERFVAAARERGLSEIGFSEHPHRFRECRAIYPAPLPWVDGHNTERLDSYLRLIEQARAAGLPVRVALEWDYIPGFEAALERAIRAYPWDYTIGSVHWLPPRERGDDWWGFDHPDRIGEWERRDVLDAYRQYFRIIAQAAETGGFDIIGHADVIKVFGYRPKADVSELYEATALAFARAGVCAEINTAGWRKPVGEVYPAPPFLRACRRAGVPTLINSDAHLPEDVGRDFDRAAAVAREAGYSEVATFANRVRTMVPL
ncbi:MAG TPA: histidinol-phosphatase HisJ family protein [bacterium]|nr:histidinol-phosphatase HisJ family protein [bacterium]